MTKVVFCSRRAITIAGFKVLIQAAEDFSLKVCGGTDLMEEYVREEDVHVDVALIDVACGLTLEKLKQLRSTMPDIAIVLWVDGATTEFISQAVGLGVLGVLCHDAPLEECLQCLRHAALGKAWMESDLRMTLLEARSVNLTLRERQLASLLAEGLRNKEIAHRLGITEGTVKVYLSRLYSKVGVGDRVEFTLMALRNLSANSTGGQTLPADGSGDGVPQPQFPGMMLVQSDVSARVVW